MPRPPGFLAALVLFAAATARAATPPRRARALRCRGGAEAKSKVKKLDPTGTPVAARLLRPATMLQAKYEALSAADPMKGLVMQVGGSLLILKLVEKSLKKLGEPTATLVARVAYVCFLALHQAVLGYVEGLVEALDDESSLTLPGNPVLAGLAKQQAAAAGGGEAGGVAASLVEKLASRETTVKAYDLDMVAKGRRSQVGSVVITGFLHLRKGMLQPLAGAVVMGLVGLLREPLVRVHVLGEDVPRPFVPPQPAWLKALQAQQAAAADEAAAEAAEDASEVVASDDADDAEDALDDDELDDDELEEEDDDVDDREEEEEA